MNTEKTHTITDVRKEFAKGIMVGIFASLVIGTIFTLKGMKLN